MKLSANNINNWLTIFLPKIFYIYICFIILDSIYCGLKWNLLTRVNFNARFISVFVLGNR